MKSAHQPRVLVVHNRDYEGAEADPENRARADVLGTAHSVAKVLGDAGYDAGTVGIGSDLYGAVAEITDFAPDVVFNLCESIDGASNLEPLLPLLLERAGLAYTGSSPLTLGLAVHKHKAKDVLRGAGVPTPEAAVLTAPDVSKVALGFPLIVKPAREDASVGITTDSVVHDRAALERQVTFVLARYLQPALVESYIEGREIYVSLLGRPEGRRPDPAALRDRLLGDAGRLPAHRLLRRQVGGELARVPRHQAGPLRGAVGVDAGPDRARSPRRRSRRWSCATTPAWMCVCRPTAPPTSST